MSLVLMLLSLIIYLFSPWELFPSIAPYHIQQIILIPAAAISVAALTMRRTGLPTPQFILMGGVWCAVVLSLLSKLWLHSSANAFIDFGVVALMFYLVLTNTFSPARVRIVCLVLAVSAVIMALQGIVAYHTGYMADKYLHDVTREGVVDPEAIKRIKSVGMLSDANDFAQFLLVGMALLGIFWKRRQLFRNVILLSAPAAVLVYAIYLTGSRGAIIGLVVLVFAAASNRLGKMSSLVLAGVFVVILVAARFGGGREMSLHEGSAAGRVMAWGSGISFLKSNPLFGLGFEQFTENNPLTAHNSFVLCFAELGLFGYFFWLALVFTTLVGLHRVAKLPVKTPMDENFRRLALAVRTSLYCFLVTSWFLSRTYSITLYVLLAMGASLVHLRREWPGVDYPPRKWIPMTFALQLASIVLVYVTIRLRAF